MRFCRYLYMYDAVTYNTGRQIHDKRSYFCFVKWVQKCYFIIECLTILKTLFQQEIEINLTLICDMHYSLF